ncbi:MAG: glucose-6-phosphate dehydrogenase [Candidatus Hydrogenedentes bacterium]|nr:glucose-6-phosphate dehydrogenase [Candidatus Hydrogenedentota bacterium]
MPQNKSHDQFLSIVVIGASGDLAVKKIFPALFALFCRKLLPESFVCYGYARTELNDEAFRMLLMGSLSCRYTPGESECRSLMDAFLSRCHYVSGGYDDPLGLLRLKSVMESQEQHDLPVTRLFYLSVPPFLFLPTAQSLKEAGMAEEIPEKQKLRVVVEKPFGRDRQSSDALTRDLRHVFTEEQSYRIDHYLGKEVVQNLMALRFANLIFEPIWNRNNIHYIRFCWSEDIGTEGRAGYFDHYGIIRDVMQNHLLQMLALITMEEPLSLEPEQVRNEKVKALRAVQPVRFEDMVIGQYTEANYKGQVQKGYLQETGVPADSITPTYGAAILKLRNRRWDGVPFLLSAGKGLNTRRTGIHIEFRHVPGNIFTANSSPVPNSLRIRVQPDAGVSLNIMTKVPGLRMSLEKTELDLSYASAFKEEIPDAYESLLLDVIQGDKSLFIRADELEAAWDIFTPVLHDLEGCAIKPQPYPFGSAGPDSAGALAALYNAEWA